MNELGICEQDMYEQGMISKDDQEEALADDVYSRIKNVDIVTKETQTPYSYFTDELIDQVLKALQDKKGYTETQAYNLLFSGGLEIHTTQDPDIQSVVDEEISRPENYDVVYYSIDYRLSIQHPDQTTTNYSDETLKTYFRKELGETNFDGLFSSKEKADEAIAKYKAAVTKDGDTVLGESVHYVLQPQASFVLIDQSSGYVKALSAKVDEGIANGNVCLMLDTQVTGVNYDGEKVTGVTATNAFGERTYDAPSVILACGGYGGNEEMLKTYNFKNVLTTCADTARGDGYTFALELGAALSGMDWVSAYAGGINTGTFHKVLSANLYTNKQPIWVTMEGNRLTNEPVANSTDQSNAWNAATDNLVYIIFNDAMLEDPSTILYGAADLKAAREEQLALGKNIWAADTIEELAQKAGIDAAGLTATVEAYDKACAGEAEDSFGRTENMIALENGGMIYAIKTMPYVMMTNGGVAMNENANIIREDGTPIVGLYQCGEQVGSDNIAGHSSVGGMAHGNCMTWGMISAENAVKHAQEQ